MRFVTRKNAAVDRIACPWLIRRFIDADAEFLYVEPDDVGRVASEMDAIPFDVAVNIDYSKKTAFTRGAVKTNFGRFPLNEKLRFLTRAAVRHLMG